jgi:asparagine synthase (glutamine-hydrolysing)
MAIEPKHIGTLEVMCGISGIISNSKIEIDPSEFARFFDSCMNHRGPDENINFIIENYGIFHMSRLAINDLRNNQYPLTTHDNNIQLIYNGEIYNAPDIRNQLEKLGYEFKTRIDGEVIVNGYLEWGDKVWNKLNGIFSVCLVDLLKQEVKLVRDYLGIKPLFYFVHNQMLVFASELSALVKFAKKFRYEIDFDLSLNHENLDHLLNNMFIHSSESTAYSEIRSIKPANFYTFSTSGLSIKKYWDFDEFLPIHDFNSSNAEKFDVLFKATIKRQLVSDVPLAIALSSGIDSNLLLKAIESSSLNKIQSYNANFVNDSRSESKIIREDHGNNNSKINFVDIDAREISMNLDKYVHLFSDLISLDGGAITTKLLSQRMREDGIKVCFFGEGADELFGGYTWFGLASGFYKYLPRSIRSSAHQYAITRRFKFNSKYPNQESYSAFKSIQKFEMINQLPNHLLVKVDRSTMSESIEGRVPYLDKELVEFVLQLNNESMKSPNKHLFFPDASSSKPILRNYSKQFLDENVSNRAKKGFMLPLDSIVKQSKLEILDLINSENFVFKSSGKSLTSKLSKKLITDSSLSVSEKWTLWRILIIQKVINAQN